MLVFSHGRRGTGVGLEPGDPEVKAQGVRNATNAESRLFPFKHLTLLDVFSGVRD